MMSSVAGECLENLSAESLSNEEKYFILMLVTAACKQHYGEESSKMNISKKLILSFIEDLKIPKQVTNGILTSLEDKDIVTSMQPYSESLLNSPNKKENFVYEIVEFLLTSTLISEALYGYDAHARVVILHVAIGLGLKCSDFEMIENTLIKFLKSHARNVEENREIENRSRSRTIKKGVLIGLTAIGGGAMIGLTGGLATPFIAAGATAVFGSSVAILGTGVGSAVLGSLFGVAGAGLTGYKMNHRVGNVKIFEFLPLSETKQLHAVVAIGGYLKKDVNDFFLPWSQLDLSKEQYILKWEPEELLQMGCAIDYFISAAKTAVVTETLKYTALSGLMTAIAWPASLLSVASALDNPWSVCINRAQDAGLILADVLINRQHGCRPVTLIGFSVGALLIYHCLKELCKRKNCEGIIQDIYIFGGPVTANSANWESLMPVIAGRIVNGYCKKDWILKFLFRFSQATTSLAGLHPITSKCHRIHNIDLTEIVNGHGDYYQQMTAILETVGIPIRKSIISFSDNQIPNKANDSGEVINNCENQNSNNKHGKNQEVSRNSKINLVDSATGEKEMLKKRSTPLLNDISYNQITSEMCSDSDSFEHNIEDIKYTDYLLPMTMDSNDATTESLVSIQDINCPQYQPQYQRDSKLYNNLKPISAEKKPKDPEKKKENIESRTPSTPMRKLADTFINLFTFNITDEPPECKSGATKSYSTIPGKSNLLRNPENEDHSCHSVSTDSHFKKSVSKRHKHHK